MNDLRFGQPGLIHLLWLVAALAVVGIVAWKLRQGALRRFAAQSLLDRLAPGRSDARWITRMLLVLGALAALVLALLDPRWGVRYEEVRQRGNDIVILLDTSRSMLAEDASPNRLERARQMCLDIVDRLHGDRVALVTFAGTAVLRCPLTIDYGAFRLALGEAGPESSARGGSLLGDAIRLAEEAFTDLVPEHKAIIILSDGEDHGSFPVEAASRLFEDRGVRIFTVGLGDADEGARIPVDHTGRRVYLTYEGEEVWSKMMPQVLKDIALAAQGAFIPAGTRNVDMGRLYEERIALSEEREFESTRVRRLTPQFQWFAGLAFVLLLVDSLMSERRARVKTNPWEVV